MANPGGLALQTPAATAGGVPAAAVGGAGVSPSLRQQVTAWSKVIDAAEKEITKKVHENNWLKSRLKAVEWESLSKGREATLLEDKIKELTEQLAESQAALSQAVAPRPDAQAAAAAAAHLSAQAASAGAAPGPTGEAEVLKTRVKRLERELEIKSQYLEDKEAYWSGEMALLEQRVAEKDAALSSARGDVAGAAAASGQTEVASLSREAQWAKEKLEMTNTVSKLRAEVAEARVSLSQATSRAAKSETASAGARALGAEVQELRASNAAYKEEVAELTDRVAVYERELLPIVEEAGLSKGSAPDAATLCADVKILLDDLKAQLAVERTTPAEPPAELLAKLEEAEARSVRAARERDDAVAAAAAASASADEAHAAVAASSERIATLESAKDELSKQVETHEQGWDEVRASLQEEASSPDTGDAADTDESAPSAPSTPTELAAAAAEALELTRAKLAAAEAAKREAAEEARKEALEVATKLAEKQAEEASQRAKRAAEEDAARQAEATAAKAAAEVAAAEASATAAERAAAERAERAVLEAAQAEAAASEVPTHMQQHTDSPRPTIVKLSLSSREYHGTEITAQGSLDGCTRCRFQWYRSDPSASTYSVLKGCNSPILFASADDVGCRLRVDAVPVSSEGIAGTPVSTSTDKLATAPEVEAAVSANVEAKEASFAVAIPGVTEKHDATLKLTHEAVTVESNGSTLASVPVSAAIDISLARTEKERFAVKAGGGVQSRSLMAVSGKDRDLIALTLRAFVQEYATEPGTPGKGDAAAGGGEAELMRIATAMRPSVRDVEDSPEPSSDPPEQVLPPAADGSASSDDIAAAAEPATDADAHASADSALASPAAESDESLPAVADLQVLGKVEVGQTMQACGNPVNGMTLCLFQWTRDGVAVPGATTPTYDLSADDVGSVVAVECTPTNAEGVLGSVETVTLAEGKRLLPLPEQDQWLRRMVTDGKATLGATNAANKREEGSLVLEPRKVSFRSKRNKALWKSVPLECSVVCSTASANQLTLSNAKGSVTLVLADSAARDLAVLAIRQLASVQRSRAGKSARR